MGKQFMSDEEFLRRIRGFNDSSLVNALMLLSEEIARQRYPQEFKKDKKRAMLKFFDDFTEAGHSVLDSPCYKCVEDCKDFARAKDNVDVIVDAVYDMAQTLAPDNLSDRDNFIFGMSLLQEFLEAAGDVVADRDN